MRPSVTPALRGLLAGLGFTLAASGMATAAEGPGPPCAACVILAVDPDQIAGLFETAQGLSVWLRADQVDASDLVGLARQLLPRRFRVTLDAPLAGPLLSTELVGQVDAVTLDARPAGGSAMEELAYAVKTRATDLRARSPSLELGLAAAGETWPALADRGLGAYIDFVVLDDPTPADAADARRLFPGAGVWGRYGRPLQTFGDLLAALGRTGIDRSVLTLATKAEPKLGATNEGRPAGEHPSFRDIAEVAVMLGTLAEVLPEGLSPLNEVKVTCHRPCESRVFLHPRTLAAVAVITASEPIGLIRVTPRALAVNVYAPAIADRTSASLRHDKEGSEVELPRAVPAFVLEIDGWRGRTEQAFASDVRVAGSRQLTVQEIVARHQAARARQAEAIGSLISSGRTVLSFEAPGFAAPLTISARTIVYTTRDLTEVEQQAIRINGLDLLGGSEDGPPRLPIIEPERISAPPLSILLTEAYEYRLAGVERIGGRDCYLVLFEPRDPAGAFFRGRVWISRSDFGMVRVAAVQTGLDGPIVASEQRDDFRPLEYRGRTLWLPSRSEIHQMYEGGAHRTPIHRLVETDRHDVNPEDFGARLRAARASSSIMLRETPRGFRYLVKNRRGHAARGVAADEGRTVAERDVTNVRTAAFGVLIDPNISRPLPFAGVSYVDFDFLQTGTQLNAFFAGTYGRAAWTTRGLGRSRWQLTGDAFAIAAEYHDRSFRNGIERYDENIKQRPAHLMAGLIHPLGARGRIRALYELDYTHFARAESTGAAFVHPASVVVHGARLAVDLQRGAWSGSLWWNPARRQRWRPWGSADRLDPASGTRDFQRFGAEAARSFVFSPRAVARLETSWMAGHDLDRFSRFAFGSFENCLRGYPSASIRYDAGAVARGVVTWTASSRLRLDGFADLAVVRDPGFGRRPRGYPGLGAALEMPAPFGLLTALEWGYGVKGLNRDGSVGTHVVRISGYKIF